MVRISVETARFSVLFSIEKTVPFRSEFVAMCAYRDQRGELHPHRMVRVSIQPLALPGCNHKQSLSETTESRCDIPGNQVLLRTLPAHGHTADHIRRASHQ